MRKPNRARSAELGHDALDAANSAEWLPAQSDPRFDSADSPLAAGLCQNETQPVMSDAPNIAVTLIDSGGAGTTPLVFCWPSDSACRSWISTCLQ
jgi:hypothetical protein